MVMILFLGAGLFWTIGYVLLIRVGLREKTYGMPIVAFAMNFSWEICFAFVRRPPGGLHWINVIWFMLDCGIAYTVVRYGPCEFPYLTRWQFYSALTTLIALAYVGLNEASLQFDGGWELITAFGVNLTMSGLFLAMLASRRSTRGQSVGIAGAKLLGTSFASASMLASSELHARYSTPLLLYMYTACLLLDLAYLGALMLVRRHETTTEAASRTAETCLRPAGRKNTCPAPRHDVHTPKKTQPAERQKKRSTTPKPRRTG